MILEYQVIIAIVYCLSFEKLLLDSNYADIYTKTNKK